MSPPRLVFVYNADAGVVAGLLDLVHKTVSPATYPCSLCGVTYGPLGMKPVWRAWLEALPTASVFFHRPDFRAAFPSAAAWPLPLVALDGGSGLRLLLSADDLTRLPTVDGLIEAIERRLQPVGAGTAIRPA